MITEMFNSSDGVKGYGSDHKIQSFEVNRLMQRDFNSVIIKQRTNLASIPSYRILMVDDEPDLRQLNVDVLTEAGYMVDTAADGVQAWAALAQGSYDLLLTDNVMPNLSGAELLQRLHARRKFIPTIMVTGTLPGPAVREQPWFQMVTLLPKPYTLNELLAAVKKFCPPLPSRTSWPEPQLRTAKLLPNAPKK